MSLYAPLSRALDVLQLLARRPAGLPLSTIAQHVGVSKSAVHRLLTTLVADGYARQDPDSEHYLLTLRLPALGFRYLGATGLADVCQPIIDRLAADTGELVQLGIVDSDCLIWVAWAQGAQSPLRYEPVFGREIILYTTGSGAAWLASLPEETALAIVRRQGLDLSPSPNYGLNAVRSEAEFRAKLLRTWQQGYGTNLEEGEQGINAIAVAFRCDVSPDGPVVGTVAVAGPSVRVTEARLQEFLEPLRATAAELTSVWPMREQILASRGSAANPTPVPATMQSATRTCVKERKA